MSVTGSTHNTAGTVSNTTSGTSCGDFTGVDAINYMSFISTGDTTETVGGGDDAVVDAINYCAIKVCTGNTPNITRRMNKI